MAMSTSKKKQIIEKHQAHEGDTGSPEVQIALLTQRIVHLTEHFKVHKKDFHSERGHIKLIGRRKKLLNYLKHNHYDRYQAILKELGLRH